VSRDQPWRRAKLRRQTHTNEHIEARETPGMGRGIYALKPFITDEVVCTFTGTVVPTIGDAPAELCHHVINTREGRVLVPDLASVGGHLANHSCRPNTAFKYSDREDTMLLQATRRIARDEEITVFYSWLRVDSPPCRCGEKHCAGYIGFRWHPAEGGEAGLTEEDARRVLSVAAANRNAAIKTLVIRLWRSYPRFEEARLLFEPVIRNVAGGLPVADGNWLLRLFELQGTTRRA
jgi:hypothetical protein